jgi:mannose-6-phosphate isomerase-like protein (cupin superfamily)
MSISPVVRNYREQLRTAPMDPAVGIRIVQVTGDDHTGLYVAELGAHHSVTAHYHKSGSEIYQIICGEGRIHTGLSSGNDTVTWNRSADLKSGDCFTVHECQVHRLENTGSEPMIACFVCPASHIGDDRFIVRGIVPRNV